MNPKIYIVTNTNTGAIRIVRTSSRQKALAHVAKSEYKVSMASADDMLKYLPAGIAVEITEDEDQPFHLPE